MAHLFLFIFDKTFLSMKYDVLRFFKRRSEGLKPYNVGEKIELNKEDAAPLIENGFITAPKKSKSKLKKDESKGS